MNDGLRQLLDPIPVIPVLTVRRIEDAVPLARALVKGGLPVIEVTLRTEAAVEAICRMVEEVPEATVGAGTLTRAEDVATVLRAGARFAVSPGLTPELAAAAWAAGLALLPGVMTASEALAARDRGFDLLKFFPAGPAGGIAMLKAFRGPLPDLLFCPTGGIDAASFRDYLALPNVICVGGSWVAPEALVAAGDWEAITELARQAVLRGRNR
ncbi:MAG: bifunctional 4-hydroxy-2-oxoglutarate aldolase/2-dehydro-3-deoxy-phosphogluconate aldolase [Thermoanaerobaculia bacterium]